MAIDSTLFAADIPAGTYAVGDTIELKAIAGPAQVRSGYGTAKIKKIFTSRGVYVSTSVVTGYISIKNSDWIDPVINSPNYLSDVAGTSDDSGSCQSGNDCDVYPNSSWQVLFTFTAAGTTTTPTTVFAIIDIDYPSVSSIQDPSKEIGIPTSNVASMGTVNLNAIGSISSATFNVVNADILKAGYRYLLQKIELIGTGLAGFVALSGAAGMGGLQRIVPVTSGADLLKYKIRYASPLVKGPMDVKTLFIASSASTGSCDIVLDWVKRRL